MLLLIPLKITKSITRFRIKLEDGIVCYGLNRYSLVCLLWWIIWYFGHCLACYQQERNQLFHSFLYAPTQLGCLVYLVRNPDVGPNTETIHFIDIYRSHRDNRGNLIFALHSPLVAFYCRDNSTRHSHIINLNFTWTLWCTVEACVTICFVFQTYCHRMLSTVV